MKRIVIASLIFFIPFTHLIFAQNITIDPITPPVENPRSQSIETDIHSSGKGIVQKASESELIINSKKYRVSKYIKKNQIQKVSDLKKYSISRGSIVTFGLNKKGEIVIIEKQHQIHKFCIVDRMDSRGLVCNDRYYRFSSNATFYDINFRTTSRTFFRIQSKVGLEFNQKRQVLGVWKLDKNLFH
jgi:hypothetical protein